MNPEAEAEQITGMVGIRRRSRELKKMFVVPFEAVVKRIFRTILRTLIQNGLEFSLKLPTFFIKKTTNCDTFLIGL